LAVVSMAVGIVYAVSMMVGKCGGCQCNVKREKSVPRKLILILCAAILGIGLLFGILANYWHHQAAVPNGVDHVTHELKIWQQDAVTIETLSEKLDLSLPNDTDVLFRDIDKTVETSIKVQGTVHRFERFRHIFLYTFFAILYILCGIFVLIIWRFSRFFNLLIFFSILLVFLPLVLLWIGGVQLPSCLFLGNLCTSYTRNLMRYIPEEDVNFAHYLTCEGEDPLADFTAQVRDNLDQLREEEDQPTMNIFFKR